VLSSCILFLFIHPIFFEFSYFALCFFLLCACISGAILGYQIKNDISVKNPKLANRLINLILILPAIICLALILSCLNHSVEFAKYFFVASAIAPMIFNSIKEKAGVSVLFLVVGVITLGVELSGV
jgi:uncharacterized membrane protein YcgQ (UPF0703/DUF1980 family)